MPMDMNPDFRLVGSSKEMKELQEQLDLVAHTDYSVLLVGETGVGKELAARRIHRMSRRRHMPFLGFNCGNLTNEIAGAQLFGHERGSFTDAYTTRIGLFERMNKGTLFLDEVETLKPDVQARFLRFLETGTFERLGGVVELTSDVRTISGTNYELCKNPDFRQDLYYRINEFRINIPPLRDHPEDIPELAEFYIALLNASNGAERSLDCTAIDALWEYSFPGNVRELVNILKRAHLFAWDSVIDGETIQYAIRELNQPTGPVVSNFGSQRRESAIIYPSPKEAAEDANGLGSGKPLPDCAPGTDTGLALNLTVPWKRGDAEREFYKAYPIGLLRKTEGTVSEAANLAEMSRSSMRDIIVNGLGYKNITEFRSKNGITVCGSSPRHSLPSASAEEARKYLETWVPVIKSYGGNVTAAARQIYSIEKPLEIWRALALFYKRQKEAGFTAETFRAAYDIPLRSKNRKSSYTAV